MLIYEHLFNDSENNGAFFIYGMSPYKLDSSTTSRLLMKWTVQNSVSTLMPFLLMADFPSQNSNHSEKVVPPALN